MTALATEITNSTTTQTLGAARRRREQARHRQAVELAQEILVEVMHYRRALGECSVSCPHCMEPHLAKVTAAIEQGKPITFVLPAFPGKSPNPAKVLSPMPDMAERQALMFLGTVCERIKELYSPGAHIVLCSDGRVFSDVVGMKEEDVTAYKAQIKRLLAELSLDCISTFDLDEVFRGLDFDQMRVTLMETFGQPLESLQEKVRRGHDPEAPKVCTEANRMYRGITRFLVEDSTFPGQTRSKTSIQKECKKRAYEVIRRSNAWSELLEEHFGWAVRLSIHPQTCGAQKLGIRLLDGDSWMTPWHGVAVDTGSGFTLVKRAKAEEMGATLVLSEDGQPSHYELAA